MTAAFLVSRESSLADEVMPAAHLLACLCVQGTSKTREQLAVVDELLAYWKARRQWAGKLRVSLRSRIAFGSQLEDADDVLEELEEALIVSGAQERPVACVRACEHTGRADSPDPNSDFGPRTSLKIVDLIRDRVRSGELKSGADIRAGCATMWRKLQGSA